VLRANVVAPYAKVPPGSGPLADELLLDVWFSRTAVMPNKRTPTTRNTIPSLIKTFGNVKNASLNESR
jgi:hypothetical protein